MKSETTNTGNIKQFKKRRKLNIGMLIFALMLVYLLVTVLIYLTTKQVSVYEVREGSILKDNSYTGLVLREESVVNADSGGYVTYFVSEGSKVKKGSVIYTLSEQKLSSKTDTGTETSALSESDQGEFLLSTQNFSDNFRESDFSAVYTLKSEISSILQNATHQTMTAQLDAMLADNSDSNIQTYSAEQDGIVVFNVDGYENVTLDSLKGSDLVKADLQTTVLTNSSQLSKGDAAYKIITGETWSIVVEISEETVESLAETTTIKTKIKKDDETLWASLSLLDKEGKHYACLTFDNSMIRYATERYLDVELILEDESGLKIPKTAVVEKEFYQIPAKYLSYAGDSTSIGVFVKTDDSESMSTTFLNVGTYYLDNQDDDDESNDVVYLDPALFDGGEELVYLGEEDSGGDPETTVLNEKAKLQGVYNINKGYAVFRRIKILCESDEYYIVEDKMTNGLSNYDHIVLDGTTVEENEIVFQ